VGYHGNPLQRKVDNTDWRMINIFYASISDLEGKTFWIGEKVYHVTLPWMEPLGRYLDTNLTMFRVVTMY
jgi:hypothetical protein